jgi:hypothetical protein
MTREPVFSTWCGVSVAKPEVLDNMLSRNVGIRLYSCILPRPRKPQLTVFFRENLTTRMCHAHFSRKSNHTLLPGTNMSDR